MMQSATDSPQHSVGGCNQCVLASGNMTQTAKAAKKDKGADVISHTVPVKCLQTTAVNRQPTACEAQLAEKLYKYDAL